MTDPVRLEVDRGVATITLDSPENRNALSRALVAGLLDALVDAERGTADGTVRAIVLTHTPPVFCAGADLKERSTTAPGGGRGGSEQMVDVMRRLMDAPVPTIAAVNGPVRAGGVGLMASCDLVVVHRDITFALTEVRLGLAAAIISVPIFRRAAPSKLAAAFLTGEPFDAAFARDAGLVTHVVDDVEATVDGLCAGIALGAPGAVTATKGLLAHAYAADTAARDRRFEEMRLLSDELFGSDEGREGMASFVEKRRPSWQTE
jgi:enoyl-CoA hydratase/carnithine racemase